MTKDKNPLPQNTYRGKSAYEYRPYLGAGKKRPCIRLCSLDAPISTVWQKWEEQQATQNSTLVWLLTEYKRSREFEFIGKRPKSKDTIREHSRIIEALIKYPLKSSSDTFGKVHLKSITKGVIRRYLDKREEDGAPVAGNREKAVISKAWNWALERDLVSIENPCDKVSRNQESSRDRYVTDDEYDKAYALAANAPAYLQPMMEIAYLCRMRRGEILKATRDQVLEDGLDTLRLKGSRDTLTTWSDRLRAAIALANALPAQISSIYIIHDKHGQPITNTAFNSAWRRHKHRMKKTGMEPFNFHDLKAKGVSDTEEGKQLAGGHRSADQTAIYDRKKPAVKPTK